MKTWFMRTPAPVALFACACATTGGSPSVDAPREITSPNVHFRNDLEACVKVTNKGAERARNLVLLSAQIQVLQSIGECGCKSALMTYRARLNDRPASSADGVGHLNTLARQALNAAEAVYLVIASDVPRALQIESISVDMTCATPD